MSAFTFCGLSLLALVCVIGQTSAYLPAPEAKRLCRLRTGLVDSDIEQYKTRNEGCAIDCITKQGTMMTSFVEDGTNCHDADGYKCVLGKCHSPEDKLDDEIIQSDLNQIEIKIKSAHVADRDPYPTQGESDAFVLVEVVNDGSPTFKDGELICYTHVIQDNSRPRWNFACRPPPIRTSARLRFVVLDSDKPDTNPQLLGTATLSLETLLNAGSQSLTLDQGSLSGGPYSLDVEIKGNKYK